MKSAERNKQRGENVTNQTIQSYAEKIAPYSSIQLRLSLFLKHGDGALHVLFAWKNLDHVLSNSSVILSLLPLPIAIPVYGPYESVIFQLLYEVAPRTREHNEGLNVNFK